MWCHTERPHTGHAGCYHHRPPPNSGLCSSCQFGQPGKVSSCPNLQSAWWARSNGLQLLWWRVCQYCFSGVKGNCHNNREIHLEQSTQHQKKIDQGCHNRASARQFWGTIYSSPPPRPSSNILVENFGHDLDVKRPHRLRYLDASSPASGCTARGGA